MPGVNDRRGGRPTIPFNSQELARATEKDEESTPGVLGEDEAWDVDLADLAEHVELAEPPASHPRVVSKTTQANGGRLAVGTTPPEGFPRTHDAQPEIRSRTSTVHDPLTTSLLAEVARQAGLPDADDK